jgi:hypothetical protein
MLKRGLKPSRMALETGFKALLTISVACHLVDRFHK